jgi:hypothetical protein
MHRRRFIALLGAAVTAARTLRAQQRAMPLIVFLGSGAANAFAPFLAAFRQGLQEGGYVEGQNVAIEYRWAEGNFDRLPGLAADLVGHKVDLILASGGIPSARAAKDATSTIPVVFTAVSDPVGRDLIVSPLSRPGGRDRRGQRVAGAYFTTVTVKPPGQVCTAGYHWWKYEHHATAAGSGPGYTACHDGQVLTLGYHSAPHVKESSDGPRVGGGCGGGGDGAAAGGTTTIICCCGWGEERPPITAPRTPAPMTVPQFG